MHRSIVISISVAYFIAFFGVGLVLASLGPVMLALSVQTGAELDDLAFLFTSRAVGYLLGSIISGYLVDKVPGHRLMFAGLLANSVATGLFPLMKSIPPLAGLSSVQGLTMGFLDTATNVLLLWLHGNQSGPWMQAMHCFFGMGALVSPLLVRASQSTTSSFHSAFWAFAVILFVSALSFLFLPSPKPPQNSLEHEGVGSGFIAALRRMSRASISLLLLVALLLGVYVGLEVSFGAYILVYSHERLGLDEVGPPLHPSRELFSLIMCIQSAGQYLTAVYWGNIALGRFLSVFVSMRLSPKQMLWIDFLGCVFWSGILLLVNVQVVLWLSSAFFGLFMASIFPTVLTLAESFMPISGKVATIFIVGASLGELALPAAVGHIFVNVGAISFAWAVLLFSVISVAIFMLVLKAGGIVAPAMKATSEQKVLIEGSEEEAQAGMLELDMLKVPQH